MNSKIFQACALGILILVSISTSAQSEDVKAWVNDNHQAGQENDQSPSHAYGPFSVFMGTAGVTLHQYFKGDRLRNQARKAIYNGDQISAERLMKKAERSEGVGGIGMFLVLPTGVIAINKEMDVQSKRSKLADEREARQMGKAVAEPVISVHAVKPVQSLTSSEAAE